MKKIGILFLSLLAFILASNCNNNSRKENINNEREYVLTWSDEFNGQSIDPTKWEQPESNRRNNAHGPDGWWSKDDSYLDGNGNLVIRVRKIENRNDDEDPYDYVTGAIRSEGKFEQKFGKFEIRCQLPSEAGWWVAFWLHSDQVGNVNNSGEDGTEIDIFEGFGWTDDVNFALHWDGYREDHKSEGKRVNVPGIREGYHTFTLEWTEKEYIFFVDNSEVWRTSAGGVSKAASYVKITGELSTESWAVGENWSNDPETAEYPDYFLVDYVRVYQDESNL